MYIRVCVFLVLLTTIDVETFIHACFMYVIMSSLRDFSIPEAYKQIRGMDTLASLEPMVDWRSLGSMVSVQRQGHKDRKGGYTGCLIY